MEASLKNDKQLFYCNIATLALGVLMIVIKIAGINYVLAGVLWEMLVLPVMACAVILMPLAWMIFIRKKYFSKQLMLISLTLATTAFGTVLFLLLFKG